MTKDEKLWCEFGCEVRIYYDHIEFSDGLRIPIPRNEETDTIHCCPKLVPPPEEPQDYMPTDPDVYAKMADEDGGHFWNDEELGNHYMFLWEMLQGIDGLEFKIYRHDVKETLVKFLNNVPEFHNEIRISGESEPLPACLHTGSAEPPYDYNDTGSFQPAALLGKFYEMDGSLEDAKKCYEIQKEISENKKDWSNRIEEIDEQLRMKKQELLIKKQISEESKKPQTPQQKDPEIKEIILAEILEFERTDLKDFAFANMSKSEFKTTLDEMDWVYHKNEDGTLKTWTDMVRSLRKKNINNLHDGQNRDDWDILSFTHKILLMKNKKINKKSPFIKNRNVVNFLYEINNYRNSLAHPFPIPSSIPSNITDHIIRDYIDYCRDHFERSKDA